MKIEFIKGRERNLPANHIKLDKERYINYLDICRFCRDAIPMTFKELYGYEIVLRYSLN